MPNDSKKSSKTEYKIVNANSDHSFINKWSPEIEQFGFTQIPNQLITCQSQLNLHDGELVTLVQLTKFWFSKKGKVYPAINTLASYTGKGYTTVQKRLKALEDKGFIRRRRNSGTSSNYDLSPLVIVLYQHQKTCLVCRKMSRGVTVKTHKVPYSKPTYKEDEPIRQKSKNNISKVSDLIGHRYEALYDK